MKDFNPKIGDIAHFKPRKIVGVCKAEHSDFPWAIYFEGCPSLKVYTLDGKYFPNCEDVVDIERLEIPKLRSLKEIIDSKEDPTGKKFENIFITDTVYVCVKYESNYSMMNLKTFIVHTPERSDFRSYIEVIE